MSTNNAPAPCFVSWDLTDKCNFSCEYCGRLGSNAKPGLYLRARHKVAQIIKGRKEENSPKSLPSKRDDLWGNIDEVIDRFSACNRPFVFGFTGGEPLIYPHFVDICARIVEKSPFRIALDTNLSIDIQPWMNAVPADRVAYIYSSMHILERERKKEPLDHFLEQVVKLQENSYKVIVNYVLYPPLIARFRKDYDYCASKGVNIVPKSFKGMYRGRRYPNAYTDSERELLLEFNPGEPFSREVPDHSGRRCKAGMTLLRIRQDGEVVRCVSDPSSLGNVFTSFALYDAPHPCQVYSCPCFNPADYLCE